MCRVTFRNMLIGQPVELNFFPEPGIIEKQIIQPFAQRTIQIARVLDFGNFLQILGQPVAVGRLNFNTVNDSVVLDPSQTLPLQTFYDFIAPLTIVIVAKIPPIPPIPTPSTTTVTINNNNGTINLAVNSTIIKINIDIQKKKERIKCLEDLIALLDKLKRNL